MTRGRRPDAPALAAAKGNPGKRRRDTAAKRAADLAAAPVASADPLAPPEFLTDARLRPALAIWRELAGELRRLNLLDTLDRQTFAMYCVHMADWIKATKDIARNGHSYVAKNVNNDDLMRLNPAVKARQLAEKAVLEIGARFGLDPSNRYRLLRDQSAAPLSGGLFGGQQGEAEVGAETTAPPLSSDDDPIGLIRRSSGVRRTH